MMSSVYLKLLLACVCIHALAAKKLDTKDENKSTRGARNFDNFFSPDNFADDRNIPSENSEEPVYSDVPPAIPSRGDKGINNYKGFWQPPPKYDEEYIPVKGFPYYVPYPTDDPNAGGNVAFPSPNQMTDMIAMINKLKKKKEDQSFLSKLGSDPKSLAILAAIIPLSIVLMSFVPLLINYFTTGAATAQNVLAPGLPSVITSIANSRMARAFDDIETIEKLVEGIVDFGAQVMEEDGCVQKTVCRTVLSQGGEKTVKQVAVFVNHLSKGDFLKNWGGKEVLESLEKGDCENICSNLNRKRIVKKY
ncbi:hypothetical protein JTE90_027410 [Oedothorax gibbosus]|uniref:Uncharacterized protein n=1 Tax=Oedothorax gibbosus TaxID=931172 RepID=A0AAV6VZB9_9ARAC|nr:hypothetical protein JTE90_027410 [Oedothorax gibbosus]